MLHLVWYIILGFIVGLIARAIMPGVQHLGFIGTTLVGIVGSLVGGVIAHVLWRPRVGARIHPAGFVLSLIGAIIVLYAWQHFGR